MIVIQQKRKMSFEAQWKTKAFGLRPLGGREEAFEMSANGLLCHVSTS